MKSKISVRPKYFSFTDIFEREINSEKLKNSISIKECGQSSKRLGQ